MSYKIVYHYGHCDVYIDGEFYCSADNEDEALREISKYEYSHDCIREV